jgi:tripartite-type tricarboxylate transporter receptor subunit TctC
MNQWIRRVAGATGALCVALAAHAGDYPSKTITIVVAGPPGGGTDAIARIVGADVAAAVKQSVLVENRAGAGGIIGSKYVASAPADGYTLLMGHVATNAIVPALIKPKPYDAVRDFVPVAMVATAPDLLVVSAKSGINTVADLLAKAKAGRQALHLRLAGRGAAAAHRRVRVREGERREHATRAVPGQRAGADRPHRRADRHDVRDAGGGGAVPEVGAAQGHRGDLA